MFHRDCPRPYLKSVFLHLVRQGFKATYFTQQSIKGLELGKSQIHRYWSFGRAINKTKIW